MCFHKTQRISPSKQDKTNSFSEKIERGSLMCSFEVRKYKIFYRIAVFQSIMCNIVRETTTTDELTDDD
jgi:hypothetical protein